MNLGKHLLHRTAGADHVVDSVRRLPFHVWCSLFPIGLPLDVMSGPVTDNQVGCDIVRDALGIMVYNAFNPQNEWLDLVIARWAKDYEKLPLSA